MSELEDLKRRVAELEAKAKPASVGWIEPRPMAKDFSLLDRTASASMPPSALAALVGGVDAQVLAGLRGDARRVTVKSFEPIVPKSKGSGWTDPTPIEKARPHGLKPKEE